MFRNFDNHDTYIDLNSKPLHGCVMFNVFKGNTVADIYNDQKVRLPNPIITDYFGRTSSQVFIDTDVTVYFYKYTGEGRFSDNIEESIDINDSTKWTLQYAVDNVFKADNELSSNSSTVVPNIDALRAIDADDIPATDGVKSIVLLGYNEAGDKEAITYIWDAESYETDNGGSVIQGHDLTGRWIMNTPTEHCDSRHFGIFGQDNLDVDISSRLEKFITYCNDQSIRPFFNGTEDYPYFTFKDVTLRVNNTVDISKFTVFNDEGSNFIKAEYNMTPHFRNANTTVDIKCADMEMNVNSAVNYEEAVLRTGGYYQWTTDFKDITLRIVDGTWDNLNIDNCTLISEHNIDKYNTISNMKIYPEMFVMEDIHLNTFINCTLDINDWKDYTEDWVKIRATMGLMNNDFQGYYGNLAAVGPGKIYNFNGTDTTVLTIPSDSIELVNVNGNFDIEAEYIRLNNVNGEIRIWGHPYVEIIDSDVTIPSGGDANYRIADSHVTFINDIDTGTFYSYNSDIQGTVIKGDNLEIMDSYIDATLSGSNIVARDSNLNDVISVGHKELEDTFSEIDDVFENCIFNGQNIIKGVPNDYIRVNTIWRNNIGRVADPIKVDDGTDIRTNEFDHYYKYSGNTGTFKPSKWHKEYTTFDIIQKKEWYNDSTLIYPNPILNFTNPDNTFNVYMTTTSDISTDWQHGISSDVDFEGFYVNIPSGYNIDADLFNLTGDQTSQVWESYKLRFNVKYFLDNTYDDDKNFIEIDRYDTPWNSYYYPALTRQGYTIEPVYDPLYGVPIANKSAISHGTGILRADAPTAAYTKELSVVQLQYLMKTRDCYLNNRYIPMKVYAQHSDEAHKAITACDLYIEFDIKRD